MRRFACSVLLAALLWPARADALPSTRVSPKDTAFLDVAHRGASGLAPEHTFAAYDLALELGADVIEQDVAPTADGHLVVLHDDTLDRTTDCTGRPEDKTLAELKRCDAGSWFNEAHPDLARPEYVGQRIPTLDEVLTRYGDSVNYYIETKIYENGGDLERRTIALLREHGLEERAAVDGQVILQSFLPQHVLRMQQLAPRVPRVFLLAFPPDPVQLAFAEASATGIGPPVGGTDRALVDDAHARGLLVHPYTADDPAELERLQAAGADGVFTNRPDRFEARRGLFAAAAPAARGGRVIALDRLPAAAGAGPPSGAALAGIELLPGRPAPLAGPPVAGISGIVVRSRRRVLALPDDQWDTPARARDVPLRVLDLRRRGGRVTVARTIRLRAPDGTPLTGATYDPEALARTPDGTLWVGEDRGPSVLRFRADGRQVGVPIRLPGVQAPAPGLAAPGNPLAARPLGRAPASTVQPSRGVQGLAVTHGGRRLVALVAGPVAGEPDPRTRLLVELSTRTRRPTGRRWRFRVAAPGHVASDLVALGDRTLLAIDRDTRGGPDARAKTVVRIDLGRRPSADGHQPARPVVDLLALTDRAGRPAGMPFPELDALALTDRGLLVVNDNDLPFSRVRRPGLPDDTELTEVVPLSPCCAGRPRSR